MFRLLRLHGIFFLLFPFSLSYAQNTITGIVTDKKTQEKLAGVSVHIKGETVSVSTDGQGKFTVNTSLKFPLTITANYIGYKFYEQEVQSPGELTIALERSSVWGEEVVVAASRMPERILEAPVSIERMNAAAIKETAPPSFYDAIANFKGVESSVQSLTFRSLSTRGFNANGNVRFNQFADGMDNQAPGLNFSVGNVAGIPDIDLENVEVLPGAASALYGAGGMNGTLLMTSKDPFRYPGLSMNFKTGVNHAGANSSEYKDVSMRYARSWNNKLAFKMNFSWLQGTDWRAEDYSNYDRNSGTPKTGDRNSDPLYDGINVYGDEPNVNYPTLLQVAQTVQTQTRASILAASGNTIDIVSRLNALPANAGSNQIATFVGSLPPALRPAVQNLIPFYFGLRNNLIPDHSVTRTGYNERDLFDYGSASVKASAAFHYKLTDRIEGIAQANWGKGNSVYTANSRIALSAFSIGQYKLELRNSNFYLRGYSTQERSGDSYNATLLGFYLNEYSSPAATWFPDYTKTYANAKNSGLSDDQANIAARQYADRNRPATGSAQFGTLKNEINSRTVGAGGGSKFHDLSNLYNVEGMYNFSGLLNNVFDLQAGSSYRTYNLHSNGTIFDDLANNITINEFGAYLQAGKKLLNDRLKLTGAFRYDKNENFEGRLTPRLSGVYSVAKNNNIRASYQTGFRNPTTQNQYIDVVVGENGGMRMVGGVPELISKYDLNTNKAYTQSSVSKFKQTGSAADLEKYTFGEFKPESVKAYEIGYKALYGKKLLLDAYYFYNSYKDFISALILLQPTVTPSPANPLGSARTISTVVNNPQKVFAHGAALGMDYSGRKYDFSGNISYNELVNNNPDFRSEFNTPKFHVNMAVSGHEVIPHVGFNLGYRWQDKYNWFSTFAAGKVKAFSTIDAQVSYRVPLYNSVVKIGGSNILNRYYITSSGNPSVGALYYISLTFDQFNR